MNPEDMSGGVSGAGGQRVPEAWEGRRVNVKVLDGIGQPDTELEGVERYALGVRFAASVVLHTVNDRGVMIASTAGASDGEAFFYPWGAVVMITLAPAA